MPHLVDDELWLAGIVLVHLNPSQVYYASICSSMYEIGREVTVIINFHSTENTSVLYCVQAVTLRE